MVKKTLVLCSVLGSFSVIGQTVVSTTGESYENATGSLSFTVGEVIINTETNGVNDLTQGFHQTNWNFVGLEDFDTDYEAIVYPNPSSDILNIEVSHFENVHYVLFEGAGRTVSEGDLSGFITQIHVKNVEPGSYQLQLLDEHKNQLKNFKLIKSN